MHVELAVTTNFTFLTGASHPEEMVERAAELGLSAIAITDRNSLAGVVRAHVRLRELGREATRVKPPNVTGADVRERARIRSQERVDHSSRLPEEALRARFAAAGQRSASPAAEMEPGAGDGAPPSPPASPLPDGEEGCAAPSLPKLIVGARLMLTDTPVEIVALAPDRAAYAALCRLLTLGKRRAVKGACRLTVEDVAQTEGLILIACPPDPLAEVPEHASFPRKQEAPAAVSRAPRFRGGDGETADAGAPPPKPSPTREDDRRRSLPVRRAAPDLEGASRPSAGAQRSKASTPGVLPAESPSRPPGGDRARPGLAAGRGGRDDPAPDPGHLRSPSTREEGGIREYLRALAGRLRDLHLGLVPGWDGRDARRFAALAGLASELGLPPVAVTAPLIHAAERRQLADVLTCIREGCTVDALGHRALPNAERRLRRPDELDRIYAGHADALANAAAIAGRCTFSLDELRYRYPDEGRGEPPQDRLSRLARAGLVWRYPDGVPAHAAELVERELELIGKLDYAPYFLTVHDIVAFARSRGILAQGRGSAANSVTCYALGITEIPPETISMVFERFVSEARNEPPDIDVDFEHERREEVIQHIYETYGRERAGLTATVIHFRSRAAMREVGKAMGLSADVTSALSGQVWGWAREEITVQRLLEVGLDPEDRRLRQTLAIADQIIGFPRHLSQHVGGFVITEERLDELCPIENAAMEDRTIIEWDKDDIDALGILKVDVLALGMLTCVRKAFDLLAMHTGTRYTLATLPPEDPATYDMLCEADSLGVFQVESRAQMNFLPRMRPRCFYDLVIEVAIIRPGPIQGDMIHPYLRRRSGMEPVEFPSEELADVLGKTLGVPLFQEQAMRIAIVGAGFTPGEADRLRRSLATFRRSGTISTFRERFIGGMLERGYDADFAERCFDQIEGFGEYGFPESHAASFALLVYASAWLKRHHPAVFACALLNSQPMGFYAPAQIVRDARAHGVTVRSVCVNASYWDNTLEPDERGGFALRLGFRQVKGLAEEDGQWIAAARGNGYPDIESLWRRAGISRRAIARLAAADAFAHSPITGLDRRSALWEAQGLTGETPLPLFADGEGLDEPAPDLPAPSAGEEVVNDYRAVRLSLRAHPLAILRPEL